MERTVKETIEMIKEQMEETIISLARQKYEYAVDRLIRIKKVIRSENDEKNTLKEILEKKVDKKVKEIIIKLASKKFEHTTTIITMFIDHLENILDTKIIYRKEKFLSKDEIIEEFPKLKKQFEEDIKNIKKKINISELTTTQAELLSYLNETYKYEISSGIDIESNILKKIRISAPDIKGIFYENTFDI
jgi:hypothetical protein